jgi:cytidylate kinase
MIITIDGPAGAGKSSAAKALARRLGFDFLDTGAMYRAVALAALEAGLDLHDQEALAVLLRGLRLELPPGRVLLNGADVTSQVRTAEVTAATGPVADSPVVRRRLAELQRTIARGRNMVCEGRDQGTVVFPDAACKFFLVADPVERARRRQREMAARGETVELPAVLEAQEARDRRDAARDLAPMRPAADAVVLDNTALGPEQVVDRMEAEVRRRCGAAAGGEG